MRNCHICFWLSASSAGRQQGSVNYSVSAQGTAQRANELLLHLSELSMSSAGHRWGHCVSDMLSHLV